MTATGLPIIRLTAICFLAYAIMSGLLTQIGVLSDAIATHFGKPLLEVTTRFGYFSAGISIGSVLSLLVYEKLSLRMGVVLCYGIILLSLGMLHGVDSWQWLPLLLFLVGTAASLGVNTAAIILALIYRPAQRGSMLLLTDLCFALAGVISAPLAIYLLQAELPWSSSYLSIAVLAAGVLLLTGFSQFPQTEQERNTTTADAEPIRGWPLSVYLCGIALTAYLLGQVAMLLWLPNYMQSTFGTPELDGAAAISRYWTGMAIGQLVLAVAMTRLPTPPVLLAIVVASTVSSTGFWLLSNPDWMGNAALIVGLCNAGFLKLTLAYAANLVRNPQRVVALVLVCASAGSASAPFISSQIVAAGAMSNALHLMTICSAIAGLTLALAMYLARHVNPGADDDGHLTAK